MRWAAEQHQQQEGCDPAFMSAIVIVVFTLTKDMPAFAGRSGDISSSPQHVKNASQSSL
jgi:hypothetical protein